MRYLLIALAACNHPHDVTAQYATAPPGAGAVDVVLNDPTRKLSISVDDQLVVDGKYSRKAHIDGVPAGPAHVHVATGGRCEQGSMSDHEVVVPPGGTATLVLPGPEPNTGCMILTGLDIVGLYIGLVAEAVLLTGASHGFHGK